MLRLTEGVRRRQATLDSYVVTPQLRVAFSEALGLIGSVLAERSSKASYLHGSFGSGKSHFMAVLHALLDGDVDARSRAELAYLVARVSTVAVVIVASNVTTTRRTTWPPIRSTSRHKMIVRLRPSVSCPVSANRWDLSASSVTEHPACTPGTGSVAARSDSPLAPAPAHRQISARVAMRHHGLVGDQVFHARPGVHDPNRAMLVSAGHRWVCGAAPVPAFCPVTVHGPVHWARRQDFFGQGDHLGFGQPHSGCAQAVDRPRTVRFVDHQQRAVAVVVGAAALRVQPATLTLRVQSLGYINHGCRWWMQLLP